jgi:quercetin dioxygenase-like cupin family protein
VRETKAKAATGAVYDLAGARHRVVLDGEGTGGVAAVVEVEILPGAATPLHSDENEDLVWYVVDGTLEFQTPEGREIVEAGGSAFFPRNSTHAFANTGSSVARALMVATPAGIEAFLRDAATVLVPGVPPGPPPPEAMTAFAEVASRHGITLHEVRA